MSFQASSWALRDAPVGGDMTARMLLMVLAEFANPDGRGAYPSVETMSKLMRKSERTVRANLAKLEDMGVIRRGDQRLVDHLRGGYRPVVWDLAMPGAGETGMPRAQERNIARILEVQDSAPLKEGDMQDSAPLDETPEVQDSAPLREVQDSACHKLRDAESRHREVQDPAPKPFKRKDIYIPPVVPQGGRQRRRRTTMPDGWAPNEAARTYAAEHGIDLARSAARFREHAAATARRLADWDAGFTLWLGNEMPKAYPPQTAIDPAPARHRHSWRCAHVLDALRRDPDTAQPDDLACNLARLLNEGKTSARALETLGLNPEWEAA